MARLPVEHRLTLADRLDMEMWVEPGLELKVGGWYTIANGLEICIDSVWRSGNNKEIFLAWLNKRVEGGKEKWLEYPMTLLYNRKGEVVHRKSKPYPSWFRPQDHKILKPRQT